MDAAVEAANVRRHRNPALLSQTNNRQQLLSLRTSLKPHKSLIKLCISYQDAHKPCLYGILLPTHVILLPTHVILLHTHVTYNPLTMLLMPL